MPEKLPSHEGIGAEPVNIHTQRVWLYVSPHRGDKALPPKGGGTMSCSA